MPSEKKSGTFKHIEIIAYILAIWSFLVLFLESIFEYYTGAYQTIEFVTAVANLILLVLTILSRVLSGEVKKSKTVVYFDLAMLILGSLLLTYQAKFVIFFLLIRQTWFIVQYILFRAFEGKIYKLLMRNPPVSLMLSFAGVILIGTILLMLPVSSAEKNITNFVNALFTATSATCVTGLIVVNTGTYYSLFGQIVILLLIQIGGLGIMTISTAFALMLGQRISLNVQTLMHKVVGETPVIDVMKLLRATVLVTVIIEFMGAIFLFSGFAKIMPVAKAIYYALFHSVSAFCNAGFSLWTNNLSGFVDSPLVNLSITFLIILGGLGFAVLIDLYHYFFASGSIRRLTLHSKIVLTTTAILIVTGFLGLYIGEYNNSMKGFTVARRVLSSWFQSVTARTAGFNTIDIGLYSSSSVLLTVLLMFIGASPGSTGGGIKTTTFSVLMLSVLSMLTGKNDLVIFKRKIPLSNAREATTLATLALAIILTIIFILMLIEPFPFEKILFEAFSAFGTVGLSMGITAQLSYAGKLLITLLMYIGRVGPLTLIYAISIRKRQPDFSFAEEKISIG